MDLDLDLDLDLRRGFIVFVCVSIEALVFLAKTSHCLCALNSRTISGTNIVFFGIAGHGDHV